MIKGRSYRQTIGAIQGKLSISLPLPIFKDFCKTFAFTAPPTRNPADNKSPNGRNSIGGYNRLPRRAANDKRCTLKRSSPRPSRVFKERIPLNTPTSTILCILRRALSRLCASWLWSPTSGDSRLVKPLKKRIKMCKRIFQPENGSWRLFKVRLFISNTILMYSYGLYQLFLRYYAFHRS